jgi:hypothetical protein
MKKQILLLLSLLTFASINAQDKAAVGKNQFKINFLTPGVVYEHGFDAKNTLYSELSLGFSYSYSSSFGSNLSLVPYISEQFRHYYNLEKRAVKGKVTAKNSGGYVAITANYNFESIKSNDSFSTTTPSLTVGPVWGFERTYKRNFNLGLNMGLGYKVDKHNDDFVPIINFSLGWVIGK